MKKSKQKPRSTEADGKDNCDVLPKIWRQLVGHVEDLKRYFFFSYKYFFFNFVTFPKIYFNRMNNTIQYARKYCY